MKKTSLLIAMTAVALTSQAQIGLPTAPYVQNFDALGTSGIPAGWAVYTNATSTSLGNVKALTSTLPGLPSMISTDTSCVALVVSGGFKNFPSATVASKGDNWCGAPPTYTNRALGVRQVSATNGSFPDSDPGAAFDLQLNNTIGITGFNLTFKLQSLDTSSPRQTTWTVDYGFGSAPTSFTAVAPASGTMTTGNKTFSNNTITVNFGTALDNKSTPVHIRIVTLAATSGSGNRPSSAIDDFTLTYTGHTSAVSQVFSEHKLSLSVLGNATSDKVSFQYVAEENTAYNFSIYDLTGRTLHTESIAAQVGTHQITVDGLHLAPGMYFAKMSNNNSSAVTKIIVQ